MPGVSPLLLGRHLRFLPQLPFPLVRLNWEPPVSPWRHPTVRPTCPSSGNSPGRFGLAPPGSAVSSNPAGTSSAGNHPAPRAVSFLLRCRPSRDPRLHGAGCPMEGGLSSGRGTYGSPFQTPPLKEGWVTADSPFPWPPSGSWPYKREGGRFKKFSLIPYS